MDARPAATAAQFPNTQWTAILALQDDAETHAREKALRRLCESYWFPLYAFARQRGMSRHDAEDAVQEFFCGIGDAGFFGKADQEKGKLRTFILTAFTRMMMEHWRRGHAQKRGGGAPHVPLDMTQAEDWLHHEPAAPQADPVLAFERHWAVAIMRAAVAVLRGEAQESPKSAARFEVLSRFLNTETCLGFTVSQAAEELGMKKSACEKAVLRLRQHFRLAVHEQVAATLENPTDQTVLEEMQQLQRALLQ